MASVGNGGGDADACDAELPSGGGGGCSTEESPNGGGGGGNADDAEAMARVPLWTDGKANPRVDAQAIHNLQQEQGLLVP